MYIHVYIIYLHCYRKKCKKSFNLFSHTFDRFVGIFGRLPYTKEQLYNFIVSHIRSCLSPIFNKVAIVEQQSKIRFSANKAAKKIRTLLV